MIGIPEGPAAPRWLLPACVIIAVGPDPGVDLGSAVVTAIGPEPVHRPAGDPRAHRRGRFSEVGAPLMVSARGRCPLWDFGRAAGQGLHPQPPGDPR